MKQFFLVVCTLGLLTGSSWSAQPINLQARTAGDLAALCAADPSTAAADAKINFCLGFAQGAVDGRLYVSADKKPFCLTAGTKRADTMREFVAWVRSAPANRDMPVLDGLFKFFGERFPCK